MPTCTKCGRENPEAAKFCAACSQCLLRECPKCWHQQRHRGRCEKCGAHMSFGWRVHAATAFAATVKEEMVNRRAAQWRSARTRQMAEKAFAARAALLALVASRFGARFPAQWIARLRSEE
ncbi:MAG TPA: hypothetical protein VMU43_08110 [Candidatus Acidoferrum sp.]|nr:hypothetical protein [Candidatus Acidoferrum sp.]